MKVCQWDQIKFIPTHGNEEYCSDHCRLEAKREKRRARDRKYYQKNKLKKHKPGTFKLSKFKLQKASMTTYLGKLIASAAWNQEYDEIHKLKQKIGVGVYNKGVNPEHTGYEGINHQQLETFNITFQLENAGPCPICGEQLQEKDITRSELICRNPKCPDYNGGLVIRGTQFGIEYPPQSAKMAITAEDISRAQKEDIPVQEVAWNNYLSQE